MTDSSTLQPADPTACSPSGAATTGSPTPASFKVGIGSISDVVFGLALSIGSLILVARTPQNGSSLVLGIYYFGFSFLIVILVWLSFRRIVAVLPHETPVSLVVNIALLFCVAIEPFLFYVLVTDSTVSADASTAFAVDLGVMMFLLSALTYLLLREEQNNSTRKLAQEIIDRQARSAFLHLMVGSICLVSALPVFWTFTIAGGAVRYDLWYFALFWGFAAQARLYSAPRAQSAPRVAEPPTVSPGGAAAEAR